MRFALLLVLALAQACYSQALCPCSGTGVCGCSQNTQCWDKCASSDHYRWVATSKSTQVALYKGSIQIGNWWYGEKEFKFLVVKSETEFTFKTGTCPVPPPTFTSTPEQQGVYIESPRGSGGSGGSGGCGCGYRSRRR